MLVIRFKNKTVNKMTEQNLDDQKIKELEDKIKSLSKELDELQNKNKIEISEKEFNDLM